MPDLKYERPETELGEEIFKTKFACYFDYSRAPNGPMKQEKICDSSGNQMQVTAERVKVVEDCITRRQPRLQELQQVFNYIDQNSVQHRQEQTCANSAGLPCMRRRRD